MRAGTSIAYHLAAVGGLVAITAVAASLLPAAAEEGIKIPPPAMSAAGGAAKTEVAVIAGGCFWGVQAVYQHLNGVTNAVSGYAGGHRTTANYGMVGSGKTGHAEAVRITYDPTKVSYGEILQVFFSVAHDPTQLNRQNYDIGTQYRSAIFPENPAQAEIAKAYIDQLNAASVFKRKIATTIEPDKNFYAAEDYHQDYLVLHPTQPYIVNQDLPKLDNLKRIFPERYRADPVLVSEASAKG